jgi:hypothetical protein
LEVTAVLKVANKHEHEVLPTTITSVADKYKYKHVSNLEVPGTIKSSAENGDVVTILGFYQQAKGHNVNSISVGRKAEIIFKV